MACLLSTRRTTISSATCGMSRIRPGTAYSPAR
jgi:hypothetical protein